MGSPLASRRPLAVAVLCAWIACAVVACRGTDAPPDAERATKSTVRELSGGPGALLLPLEKGSVRFAAIGDSGRGDRAQNEVAQQMVAWRQRFPFEFVVMLGDNVYDRHTPADYAAKFEVPYRPLLDQGVTFHAAIGNHDDPGQIYYEKFNMGGERYHTFRKAEGGLAAVTGAGARFFALDSRSLDPEQLAWLQRELDSSGSTWKIVYFHHPIYTSGRYQAGARALRLALEPLLIAGDVDVVLSGHEHFYERLIPQHGIHYFVSGAAGSLRKGDIRATGRTARGFDTDYHFMLFELSGERLYFQAVSRTGETVDAGVIERTR